MGALNQPMSNYDWETVLSVANGNHDQPVSVLARLMMKGLVYEPEPGRPRVTEAGWAALNDRAADLVGCTEGSDEEAQLVRISDVLDRVGR